MIYLREYLKRTRKVRSSDKLLIQTTKPHKGISRETLRRWTKETLGAAGIDIDLYKPHSTRSAAVSVAASKEVSINTILQSAGWKSSNTFAKFYKRPIRSQNSATFSTAVLSSKQH